MRVIVLALASLAFTLGLAGCKSKDQVEGEKAALQAELDKIQGKWKIASREGTDEDADDDSNPNSYTITIKGDTLEHSFGNEVMYRQKMAFSPGTNPKQADLTYVDADGKAITRTQTKKGLTGKKKKTTAAMKYPAIYLLEGDRLKIASSFEEKKRPTDSELRGACRGKLSGEPDSMIANKNVDSERQIDIFCASK